MLPNKVCIRFLDVEKEKAFDMVRNHCEHVMKLKEQKLDGMVHLIEKQPMECEFKVKSIESIRALLQEHEEELPIKEKEYDTIQMMSIKMSNKELKPKEKKRETIQNTIATIGGKGKD